MIDDRILPHVKWAVSPMLCIVHCPSSASLHHFHIIELLVNAQNLESVCYTECEDWKYVVFEKQIYPFANQCTYMSTSSDNEKHLESA